MNVRDQCIACQGSCGGPAAGCPCHCHGVRYSWVKFALVCVSAAVVVGVAAVSYVVHEPTSYAPPGAVAAPVAAQVTLTLHVKGDQSTRVSYTASDTKGHAATHSAMLLGPLWSTRVTVPAGTTVSVRADGGLLLPDCSITDEADTTPPLDRDNEASGDGMARCEWVAK